MVCGGRKSAILGLIVSLVALLLVGVSGCGGSGGNKVLYAVGVGSPNVTIFDVVSGGALDITGNSVSTGSAPDVIAIDPLLRFAYVLDSAGGIGAGAVSQYVLTRKTGALTVATFSSTNGSTAPATPVPTGADPSAMVIDVTGNFVFVANQGSNSVSGFTIDQVGGTLTEIKQLPPTTLNCMANQITPCPLPTAGSPTALATTGTMLFVALTNTTGGTEMGSIATYMFTPEPAVPPVTQVACPAGPGCLQSPPPSPVAAGTNPVAMALDPSGKFLFVADSVANTLAAFSVGSSGQLTALGAPIATGTTPVSISVSSAGGFVYTANQGSSDVSAFSYSSSGLTAVSGSPFSVLPATSPSYVLTDTSGKFLFVAERNSNNISVFTIGSSGALAQVTGSPFASPVINPVALATIN